MVKNCKSLLEKIEKSSTKYDVEKIKQAYELANNAHKEQKRVSGTPYITHPVSVACSVVDMNLDTDSVCAALLHDVVEDTEYTKEDIARLFGEEVALLVDGVTKLDKIDFSSKEERDMENMRKMFLAMASDIRVIMIKFADRLHNLSTLIAMPEEKQREKARETLNIFSPLAHRLGMYKIKWELEDMSLKYIDPIAYHEIVEGINQKRQQREDFIAVIKTELKDKLQQAGIECRIDGRPKHFYSIYRKMFTQNKTLDQIYDLFAVRIITNTVTDCYAALGIAHELYKPMPGRFKDYIAMPKPNMYQSLHTTVIGEGGRPFEIQIRTNQMHEFAENGIAAHWKYKEGSTTKENSEFDQKLSWIKQLLEMQSDSDNEEDFIKSLKLEMFTDQVFVFSPKGDVYSFPRGATPIDFAFSIHSAIGCKMQGARVNGKIVNLDYEMKNGDIVEIITSSAVHGPSRDWLKIVKTGQAKTKINQWFKKENRELNIEKGREALERELKRIGFNPDDFLEDASYTEYLVKRYGYANLDDIYSNIGYGGLQPLHVAHKLRDEYKRRNQKEKTQEEQLQQIQKEVSKPTKEQKGSSDGIIVKGIDNCLIRYSKCCNPVTGDSIVGYITRGRGVSIHRQDCVNVAAFNSDPEERARLIDVSWEQDKEILHTAQLSIVCTDRKGLILDVINVINDMKMPIKSINSREAKGNVFIIETSVELGGKDELMQLIRKLSLIPSIIDVSRK